MKHPATIEAVLRTLARVKALAALRFNEAELAELLLSYYEPGEIRYFADYLESLADAMLRQAPTLRCAACDKNLRSGFFQPRRNGKYCDDACRQKAYRERRRVTLQPAVPPLEASRRDDASPHTSTRSVTELTPALAEALYSPAFLRRVKAPA
jgi:hypothetical protein